MKKYNELANVKISDRRSIVISSYEKDDSEKSFTISQKMSVDDAGQKIDVFLKNSIHVDLDGLIDIRNAIDVALDKYEIENNWDND